MHDTVTRALFFDVDGTLIPFGSSLPDDTRKALLEAHDRGHLLFVATGRSPGELDRRLEGIPFDGAVFSGGARAFAGQQDIFSSFVSAEDLSFFLEESEGHGWLSMLQTDSASWYSGGFIAVMEDIFRRYLGVGVSLSNLRQTDSLGAVEKVTKLVLITPQGDMDRARRLFSPRFDIIDNTVGVPASLMAEVCQKNVNKAGAMKALLDWFGLPLSASIAFGDGSNDVEMLRQAGIGVAMGTSGPAVVSAADYVTAACDKDGIGDALRHFGVIG